MTAPARTWRIIPGEVRVASVTELLRYPDVRVYELDLHSKYAVAGFTFSQGNEYGATFHATERALHTDAARRGEETSFVVNVPPDEVWDWVLLADCARYTARVVMYRRSADLSDPVVTEVTD